MIFFQNNSSLNLTNVGLFHFTHLLLNENQDNGKRFRKRAKRPTTMAIELVSIHVKKRNHSNFLYVHTNTSTPRLSLIQ